MLLNIPGYVFAQGEDDQLPDSLVHRADSLYKAFDGEASLSLYQQLLKQDSTFYPALWRTSMLYSRMGFDLGDEQKKKRYYEQALDLARKALKTEPDRVESHFAMGVALGRNALIAGARERVSTASAIKEHAEKAVKADSTHAGAHHLLGRWHLKLSNLNFAEKMAARWLYGGIPEGASMDQALSHLKQAAQLDPNYVIHWYDLGRAYHIDGKTDRALNALEKAVSQDPKMKSDQQYQQKAEKLYNELK